MLNLTFLSLLLSETSNGIIHNEYATNQGNLHNDYMTKDMFQCVFAIDQLPATCHGMYVVNTDEQDKPGEHWLTVYDNEYFDSYVLRSEGRWICSQKRCLFG